MIAAVVLASGFSRRMGRSKLELELGGRTFLQRAIDAATHARGIERCLVVVRPEDEPKVSSPKSKGDDGSRHSGSSDVGLGTLDLRPRIEVILNPGAAEGQSASIRLAAKRLAGDESVEAAIFAVVDQPFLTGAVFERLVSAWQANDSEILVSSYDGQRGNPVLFARRFFPELGKLTGDVGGRDIMRRHPEAVREIAMPDAAAGQDVDTWEDYQRAQKRAGR